MNEELKPRTFRVSEEVAEKFKALCADFENQNTALNSLISAYEVQTAKAILLDRETEIKDYETHLQALQQAFLYSLELNENAEQRIRQEFKTNINSQALTISKLQSELQSAKNELETAKEELNQSNTKILNLKSQYETAKKSQEQSENMLNMYSEKINNYKTKLENYDYLENQITSLKQELQETKEELINEKIKHQQQIEKMQTENYNLILSYQKKFLEHFEPESKQA